MEENMWLTGNWLEPSKIPAPPEAKLTPVTAADSLFLHFSNPLSERYGGVNGKPNFSAIYSTKKKIRENTPKIDSKNTELYN